MYSSCLHITSTLHETASQADFANWCYQVINHANNTFRSVPSKPFNSYKVAHTHYCPFYGGGVTTYLQKQDILHSKGSLTWTLINCLLSETSWDLTNYPALVLLDTQGILFMVCRWINPFKPLSLYTLFLAGYICISALIFPYTRTKGTHIQVDNQFDTQI